jgi:hypothetical protein
VIDEVGTMRRIMVALSAIALMSAAACAQNAQFQAGVDRTQVGTGEQFTLQFTLTNAGTGGGKNLQLPDLSKFHIMSGPNQSSSMQIINGAVSSSVTYSYVLQPKDAGKFTIGAASIDAGGATLKSAPVAIEVVKGSARAKPQAGGQDDAAAQIGDNLLLKATVDRTHVVQGEQVNIVFKIYTRVSIASYAVEKNPTMTGFWGEDVETPKNIQTNPETVNGKQFRVGIIKRMALFPTQSGSLEIGPMEVQTTVQVQDRRSTDPFESFFRDPFGRQVNYMVRSEAIRIRVDPLPPDPPSDFKGAVGQFAMSTTVDKKTTRTNEPINLKVTVSGTGNIKLIESPAVELPADFEQYTPKVSDNINRTGDRISGSKTFEYLLIPRYPGLKVIKPVTFSYYDPAKKGIREAPLPPGRVECRTGGGGGDAVDLRRLAGGCPTPQPGHQVHQARRIRALRARRASSHERRVHRDAPPPPGVRRRGARLCPPAAGRHARPGRVPEPEGDQGGAEGAEAGRIPPEGERLIRRAGGEPAAQVLR